ncbi:MAG: hypothetical protein AAB197_06930, partial [Deltaproteobacteria bacterium]
KALEYAKKACELTDWKDPYKLDTLAAAYAEAGQFDEAIKWQEKALEFPEYPKDEREKADLRLKLYKEGKPYREMVIGVKSYTFYSVSLNFLNMMPGSFKPQLLIS